MSVAIVTLSTGRLVVSCTVYGIGLLACVIGEIKAFVCVAINKSVGMRAFGRRL
jgi:hypothetical protein